MAKKRTKKSKTKGGSKPAPVKNAVENRKARHRYEILDSLECGMVLQGSEVKSIRDGKLSLDEAYGRIQNGELWLMGADIGHYSNAGLWNHDPRRPRRERRGGETMKRKREIKVDYLARVEGEGGMYVKFRGNEVEDVQLKIYEPPRFFEAFLRGRKYIEASDITARICGICPVAYQMSAVHAMEQIFGVKVEGSSVSSDVYSTAASGSRAMCCTSPCCTRRTFSAIRTPSASPRTTARSWTWACG